MRKSVGGLKHGFVSGLGWAFGVTVGFAIISTLIVFFLSRLQALPWIGEKLEPVLERTESTLEKRSPIVPAGKD